MDLRRLVLVVSPELETRRLFVDVLVGGGIPARSVGTASEALVGTVALRLVDLGLRDVDGIEFVQYLARHQSHVPTVAIGARGDDARIIAAIRAGAHGCIYADDPRERLVGAAREALDGGRPMSRGMAPLLLEHVRRTGRSGSAERKAVKPLTDRERVVLCQLARGYSYEDIGKALDVSVNTVRTYVRSLYEKLDVNSRTEAVLLGMKLGIVNGTPYPMTKPRT
jgi:DNA-binding NarL/FixJ family response regulator